MAFCALNLSIIGPRALPLRDHDRLAAFSFLSQPSSCVNSAFFADNASLISSHRSFFPFTERTNAIDNMNHSFHDPNLKAMLLKFFMSPHIHLSHTQQFGQSNGKPKFYRKAESNT
uniref:Uncharacterized protein n=1 Tax=Opuntia streptacantha TaxID=393608 RepID=A0A7C9E3N3_OPUST